MIEKDVLKEVKLIGFDFDGVFTDNSVFTDQFGVESVRCWRSDGIGLSRLSNLGIISVIVSTETNPVVSMRAQKLKLPCFQAVEDKAEAILQICKNYDISPLNTMFVGNDINDIPAFKVVKFPVGVGDSYPEILPHVLFKTQKQGGYGAVREICDLFFNSFS